MKKIIVNGFITFGFGLVIVSIIGYFVTIPKQINIRDVKVIKVDDAISLSMDIKDKVVVQKTVNNVDYLNSWKLSATIVGNNSFAMVIKDTKSRVLQLKNTLEGYTVKEIHKNKVLFSTTKDDVWLYVKRKQVNTNNPGINKVMPTVGTYNIRTASFKRYLLKPEILLKTVNIMPEFQSGNFDGMKVKSLLEGSFLYENGLRKGDIIKKINGKKLLSIADGITGYQSITTRSKFSISVLRNNKIEELKYEIVK